MEIESVRRTWGGLVRHGPRRIIILGRLRYLENYRDGLRHGKQERFDAEGRAYITAEFRLGRLVKFHASDEYDQRLARRVAEGTIDNERIAKALFDDARIEFIETPLKDAIQILQDTHGIPITCQGLRNTVTLAEPLPPPRTPSEVVRLNDQMQLLVPVDPRVPDTAIELQMLPVAPELPKRPKVIRQLNLPITAAVRDVPLIVALGKILQPHDLVCDYRYGMLWVAERAEADAWKDPTGVTAIVPPKDSHLAATWENNAHLEFIETPIRDALQILKDTHGVQFDVSHLPSGPISVTCNYPHLPFRHCLGAMLDGTDLQAQLDGETIVIALQPDHPLAASPPLVEKR
jgi:hypothetical protein